MSEINLMRVPNFGIEGFVTFKEKNNMSFRPSATHTTDNIAYSNALSELLEERDMTNYVPIEMRGEVNSDFYRNLEIIGDTNWYNLEKQYVELKNVSDPSDVVLFPKELVLFKSNYDLHEKKQLHWSSSEGYSHDINKITALNKGKSEIIEHHTKMFWWFGRSKIIEKIRVKSSVFDKLKKQKIIKSVRVFEILESNQFSYSTIMAVLETTTFPFLSVGFGTNTDEKNAMNHALLEAIHTFRGENWYNLSQVMIPHGFSKDFWNRVDNSLLNVRINSEERKSNSLQPTFYYLTVGNSPKGFTTRVYSPELQPLISNQFVPFYFPELCTIKNVALREKYRGTPFI
ncbi:YcaO-like family protein [Leuconostoc gelidum subsp. gasicomitatum]|uniref:YcaO-like family protein n=1 Tax=Leuconostoc gasicomitatum TaxID=115778 RepID=UPI001CC37DA4|nr:YcaO-like family protein [Leuconostoc gasicomitatum]MBZ5985383.1 YcaO-like family protein [Leuconostoc gasicomitatum]